MNIGEMGIGKRKQPIRLAGGFSPPAHTTAVRFNSTFAQDARRILS